VADTPQSDVPDDTADDQEPVERLQDHLDEVTDKSDEMQARLDHLEEGIEHARRQAEADDLLPEGGDAAADGPPIAPKAFPRGNEERETAITDAEFEHGG
jgi:hypothetical protein